jgi:dienelactone hydrolase
LPNPEAFARLGELMPDPLRTRAVGLAGLDVLLAHEWIDPSRVAAIGYCYGGTMVLELARSGAALGAVVGFHAGLATTRPEDAGQIKGSVLVCLGADDPFCPPEQRRAFEEEMGATDIDWRVNLYGGAVHSFTDEGAGQNGIDGTAYHRPTDERSWRAMLDLFDEKFAAGGRG